MPLPDGQKFDDMCVRSDRYHNATDRQTDGERLR